MSDDQEPFVMWLLKRIATTFVNNPKDKELAQRCLDLLARPEEGTIVLSSAEASLARHWYAYMLEVVTPDKADDALYCRLADVPLLPQER